MSHSFPESTNTDYSSDAKVIPVNLQSSDIEPKPNPLFVLPDSNDINSSSPVPS